MRRRSRRWIAVASCRSLVLLVSCVHREVAAQDAAQLSNGTTVRGEIIEYDERGLKIRLDTGRTVSFAPSEIEAVVSPDSDRYQSAVDSLGRRDYPKAAAQFQEVVDHEKRAWVQHRGRVGLIAAMRRMGRLDQAGRIFLDIFSHREDPEVLALAPLIWNDESPITVETRTLAQQWMTDERPAARLLAASWLLKDGDQGARDSLDQLQTLDQRIGAMARAQIWRVRTDPTNDEIDRFRRLIGRLPPSVRAGPQFVLATSLARSGRHEEAALAYLWIPYVYSPLSDLAADALLRAAQATRQCGFQSDSDKIYREVVQTYPGTAWATRAEKELSGESTNKPMPTR